MAEYNLGTARGRIEIDSRGASQGVRGATKDVEGFRGKLEAAAPSLRRAGKLLMGLGAAALAGVGIAVKAAANFEKEISKFQAAAQETPEILEEIRQKALQIGRDTSFGAAQAAQAITSLSYAGISTRDILDGAADAAVALAEAGELDIPTAASIAASAMNMWQIEAKDLDRVSNTLIGTFANTDTMVDQLGEAFQNVGATASILGVSIEDTATALGILANRGIKGGKAGTTLNRMLLQLTSQTPKAAAVMKELGLITEDGSNRFFDAEGNLRSMSEVAGLLQGALKGLTKEQQAQALETIFGARALAAATALAEAGAEGFDELAASIGEVDAADVAAEKLDNLSGAMTILKGTIETALIAAGSPVQDVLMGIVRAVTRGINAFASMDPRWQKMITFGIIAGGVLLFVVGAFLMLLGMIPGIIAGFAVFTGTILPMVAPIFAIVAGIAALAAGLVFAYRRSEKFRDIVHQLGQFLRENFLRAFKAVSDFVQGALRSALTWLTGVWEDLQPQIQEVGALLRVMVARFMELVEVVTPFARAISEWLVGAFERLWSIAQPVLRFLAQMLGDTLRLAIEGIVQVFRGAVNIISGLLEIFIGAFTGDWSRMWEGVKDFARGIFDVIVGAIKLFLAVGILKVFAAGFSLLRALVRGAWGGIRGIFTGALNGIRNTVRGGIDSVRLHIWRVLERVRAFIANIWSGIRSNTTASVGGIRNMITNGFNFIRNTISTVLNFILRIVRTIFNAILSPIRTATNIARSLVTAGFNGLRTAANVALNGLIRLVRAVPGRIRSGLGNLGNLLLGAGRALVQGLINGIRNMARAAMNAAKDIVSSVVGVVNTVLRRGSPSKLFVDIGVDTILGLIRGLKDMSSKLNKSMKDVVGASVGAGIGAMEPAAIVHSAGDTDRRPPSAGQQPPAAPGLRQDVHIEKIEALDPREAARIADEELGWALRTAVPGFTGG